LEVVAASPEQTTLRLLQTPAPAFLELSVPDETPRLVAELGLPDTPTNRAVVQALISQNLPVTVDAANQLPSVAQSLMGVASQPDYQAIAVVLNKDLPLTQPMLAVVRTGLVFHDHVPSLMQSVQRQAAGLLQTIQAGGAPLASLKLPLQSLVETLA